MNEIGPGKYLVLFKLNTIHSDEQACLARGWGLASWRRMRNSEIKIIVEDYKNIEEIMFSVFYLLIAAVTLNFFRSVEVVGTRGWWELKNWFSFSAFAFEQLTDDNDFKWWKKLQEFRAELGLSLDSGLESWEKINNWTNCFCLR